MTLSKTLDESLLIRECAGLYGSFALESFANFLLGCTFCYLSLLIACKNQLEQPGLAAMRWLWDHVTWAVGDWYSMMRRWDTMPREPLDQRLAFCRKLNFGICILQLMVAFLALTRWLHIGNINGFRYLGYSVTCSLMQAELVIIIAPYVPLFKMNVLGVMAVTFATMISGWLGSLEEGFLWEDGSFEVFVKSGNLDDILWTSKGHKVLPAFICLAILILVQIPFLALTFIWNGGLRPHRDLPYHFLRLLALVELTWPCFGLWWFLSADGARVIHDTKGNTFGFCFLNIISKGGFTLLMLKISREHRAMWTEDCAVTPRAVNQELWIVQKLMPYDPSYYSASEEKKYTESDLEEAVANILAKRGLDRHVNKAYQNAFQLPPGPGPETLDQKESQTAEMAQASMKGGVLLRHEQNQQDQQQYLEADASAQMQPSGRDISRLPVAAEAERSAAQYRPAAAAPVPVPVPAPYHMTPDAYMYQAGGATPAAPTLMSSVPNCKPDGTNSHVAERPVPQQQPHSPTSTANVTASTAVGAQPSPTWCPWGCERNPAVVVVSLEEQGQRL
eukprot:TRINITY_DN1339_c0_g1_i1.p1 TRINITY_DN1339_c0_g1~~TRINITY_DN1339_c0_g1_i1.p1  ORF type:complete len:597 (-),score=110.51 TRINITY_DN1339_c0_g1_i1:607-2292(-)